MNEKYTVAISPSMAMAGTPPRRPEIPHLLERLQTVSEALSKITDELDGRLRPLVSQTPINPSESNKDIAANTALGHELQDLIHLNQSVLERLSYLLGNLEI